MFTFTPLLGAQSETSKASQSILELDGGVKILIDVGWDESFDPSTLNELEKCDLILPSTPLLRSFGSVAIVSCLSLTSSSL